MWAHTKHTHTNIRRTTLKTILMIHEKLNQKSFTENDVKSVDAIKLIKISTINLRHVTYIYTSSFYLL